MDIPKTPRAKRAANDRWDKENMITLGCKVKREEAALFKALCAKKGITSNTALKEFVGTSIKDVSDIQPPEQPQDGELVLTELGYDPLAKKPLFVEKSTGKQYFVERVKDDGATQERDEDDIPF